MLRVFVIGIAALFVAGFGLIFYVGMQPAGTAAMPAAMVSVVAAAHALRAGSLLQPGDLAAREVPADGVPTGAHADNTEQRGLLVGAMVRRMLVEHEVIAADDVLRPGERGFLAAVLQPGTRAVSVSVDSVSGEAGLIWPGDRVDLILTQTIENSGQSLAHRVAGETVLFDVRVIAVDQQMVQGGQAGGLLDGRQPASRTITLEVTPRDAARVAVATRLGKLLVVLRAAQPDLRPTAAISGPASRNLPRRIVVPDMPTLPAPASVVVTGTDGTVWGGDVSHALGHDGKAPPSEVRLFQGNKPVEAYKF